MVLESYKSYRGSWRGVYGIFYIRPEPLFSQLQLQLVSLNSTL